MLFMIKLCKIKLNPETCLLDTTQVCGPLCRLLFQHNGELCRHQGQREVKMEKATPAVPHQTNESLAPQFAPALSSNIPRSITVREHRRSITHIKSLSWHEARAGLPRRPSNLTLSSRYGQTMARRPNAAHQIVMILIIIKL